MFRKCKIDFMYDKSHSCQETVLYQFLNDASLLGSKNSWISLLRTKNSLVSLLGTKNGLTSLLRSKFCWASLLSSKTFETILNVFLSNVRSHKSRIWSPWTAGFWESLILASKMLAGLDVYFLRKVCKINVFSKGNLSLFNWSERCY